MTQNTGGRQVVSARRTSNLPFEFVPVEGECRLACGITVTAAKANMSNARNNVSGDGWPALLGEDGVYAVSAVCDSSVVSFDVVASLREFEGEGGSIAGVEIPHARERFLARPGRLRNQERKGK